MLVRAGRVCVRSSSSLGFASTAHLPHRLHSTSPAPAAAPAAAAKSPEDVLKDKVSGDEIQVLQDIEQRVTWLASLMVHHANNVRPKRDGIKVGGHQASSASVATILTALYMKALRPQDRVAVKPHASPIYHSLMYLMGRQTLENMQNFRAFGGVQSYPSRTKDLPEVDISTGSVGLGAALTSFTALTEKYLTDKGLPPKAWPGTQITPQVAGRHIAIVGDAELDEGNVFEALLETWKLNVTNNWMIVDYNRQVTAGAAVPPRRSSGAAASNPRSSPWRSCPHLLSGAVHLAQHPYHMPCYHIRPPPIYHPSRVGLQFLKAPLSPFPCPDIHVHLSSSHRHCNRHASTSNPRTPCNSSRGPAHHKRICVCSPWTRSWRSSHPR